MDSLPPSPRRSSTCSKLSHIWIPAGSSKAEGEQWPQELAIKGEEEPGGEETKARAASNPRRQGGCGECSIVQRPVSSSATLQGDGKLKPPLEAPPLPCLLKETKSGWLPCGHSK